MKRIEFDTTSLIEALRGAMLLSRQALQVEIAVGMLTYFTYGDTGMSARKVLRGIYASAGRADCLTSDCPSYNTVNRRMGRVADFYAGVKPRALRQVLGELKGAEAVDSLVKFLEPYQIASMDDLLKAAGGGRDRTTVKEHERRIIAVHIKTQHLDFPVPVETPISELWEFIDKLTEFARSKQESQGEPSLPRARPVRSRAATGMAAH